MSKRIGVLAGLDNLPAAKAGSVTAEVARPIPPSLSISRRAKLKESIAT
jgi:hypothetical protein